MNPYESPTVETATSAVEGVDDVHNRIGRLAVTWEKLRFLYNLILVVAILLAAFARPVRLTGTGFWSEIVLGILVANAAYCLGPLIDGYLNWFGLRLKWMTLVLFGLGTLAATAVTFVETFFYGAMLK